jgi:transcriptional regulator with GAF, ATPase, and Fis domain
MLPLPSPFPAASVGGRIEFETLISDTSARLITVEPVRVDAAVEEALQRVMAFFQAERCGLLTVSPDYSLVTVTHAAYAPDVARVSGDINLLELFPWSAARLLIRREPVLVSRMSDLPEDAAADKASWDAMGTLSNLTVPIVSGSEVSHLIVVHSVTVERTWPPEYGPRLRLLGEIMANAVQRRDAVVALLASEERLARAAAAGRCGLWDYDARSGDIWVTPEARRIYGLSADERPNLDRFVGLLHPEDRDRVVGRIEDGLRLGESFQGLYRIVHDDGSVRWIRGIGTPDPSGLRLLGASLDETDLVHALAREREQAARIAAAVEAVELGFSEWNVEDARAYVDPRFEALLGLRPGEAQHLPDAWLNRIDTEQRDAVRDRWQALLKGEAERATLEYRHEHPDRGWTWLRHTLLRVSEPGSPHHSVRLIGAVQDITEAKNRESALEAAHEEVKRLRDRLERENVYLRREAAQGVPGGQVGGRSPALRRVLTLADQVAPTTSTVLLMGETGTGKERFAAHIHERSPRHARHMVRVNCSAIPSALIESELFGREKGAYTGALSRQIGRFEVAHGSTLFLDEIGDLPPEMQVKLLRVLQERTIERLGSPTPIAVDVRIIVATNRDLDAAVREGTFRSDLYYRLNVFPIVVPPLRERREDIPTLVEELVRDLAGIMRKRFDAVDRTSLEALAQYDWPGNVRELRNVIERAMILSPGPVLSVELPTVTPASAAPPSRATGSRDLRDVEREHILRVLESTGWRIRGERAAAAALGIKPTTLEARMAKLGIRRPGTSSAE